EAAKIQAIRHGLLQIGTPFREWPLTGAMTMLTSDASRYEVLNQSSSSASSRMSALAEPADHGREPLVLRIGAALLARGAVRRGRHIQIRCPALGHEDRHPSCDVDLSRGFICRSCGRGGSLRELAVLLGLGVGLRSDIEPRRPRTRVPPAPTGVSREAWVEA